ncbi:MAG: hypothetical protein CMO43_14015 [Verrucomicrobiales bacterium]|nr:hypothetical protein [Verrucomicrobiales bacterium]
MMERVTKLCIGLALGLGVVATSAHAVDLAFYAGPPNPGWISEQAVERETNDMVDGLAGIFDSVTIFGDGDEVGYDSPLGLWTKDHTSNGQKDVLIISCGTMPSGLYQFPNADPDGSRIEDYFDGGNVVINIADWFGYMSYEGGVRSADNGGAGAANILDIPGQSFGSRSNNMEVNADGEKYLPSLEDFTTARPWHLEQFDGTDWDVTPFALSGNQDADPAVAVNSVTGGVLACIIQKDWPLPNDDDDNRGEVVVEFVTNWLTDKGHLGLSVDSGGKLSTIWGNLKQE